MDTKLNLSMNWKMVLYPYIHMGISAVASVGQAAEIIPAPVQLASVLFLMAVSIRPIWRSIHSNLLKIYTKKKANDCCCTSEACAVPVLHSLNDLHHHDHKNMDCGCK